MIANCHAVYKSFNEQSILKDISFHIEDHEKVALVGNNGAGKTTLFRILTGELAPDNGEVFFAKGIRIGYLEQNMHFNSGCSVYEELLHVFDEVIALEEKLHQMEEEIAKTHSLALTHTYDELRSTFENMRGYEYKSLVRGVLKGLGLEEEIYTQPITTLSGGQKTRVALAKLLLEEPDLLLLDEPTNHLDIVATEWLENYLRSYKGSVLIISHDRYFLDRVVTKVIHLEFGHAMVYNGDYSHFVIESEKVYEAAMNQYEKQQQEIAKQKAVIAKLRQFNREKSIKRARSREKLLEKIEVMDLPMIDDKPMNLVLTPRITSGNDVLTVKELTKSFEDGALFNNITFDIKRGEKVAIVGPNGVGKTTLFRMIMAQSDISGGSITLGSNVHIGYYDQEHATLNPNYTIMQEIQDAFPDLTNTAIRNMLASFLFTGEDVFKPISALSGGEKGRVALAKIMLSKANFLILDEPTNHLDMMSKEVLENALNQYEGTILYVSHDRYFINQTATKVLDMQKDHMSVYLGDYDYYMEKKKEIPILSTSGTQQNTPTSSKEDWQKQKELQNRIKKLQSTLTSIEEKIEIEEGKLAELDEQLCLEEVYTNPDASRDIMNQKAAIEENIASLYTNWEETSEELEMLNS
ncbi:MAG: ABC-F family ATP-binding cassette domain-containing protein [Niameybacter sp.]|nr:ABC-F family ATP-binding cassette domain-containing protein [Niameybacter sp.]